MTSLSTRKTKLTFETGDCARFRGKLREVIIECESPFTANVRLKGTRQRLPISYSAIYDLAAKLEAIRVRAEKQARRKGGR